MQNDKTPFLKTYSLLQYSVVVALCVWYGIIGILWAINKQNTEARFNNRYPRPVNM